MHFDRKDIALLFVKAPCSFEREFSSCKKFLSNSYRLCIQQIRDATGIWSRELCLDFEIDRLR